MYSPESGSEGEDTAALAFLFKATAFSRTSQQYTILRYCGAVIVRREELCYSKIRKVRGAHPRFAGNRRFSSLVIRASRRQAFVEDENPLFRLEKRESQIKRES
jgi:hypothetical protein